MGSSVPLSPHQIRVLKHPHYCSSRPWSFFITFYVILILAAAGLPFILGRVINISTRLEHQSETYAETTIWGDLSESDITAAVNLYNASTASFPLFLDVNLENLTLQNTAHVCEHLDLNCVHGSISAARRRTIEVQRRQRVFPRIGTIAAQV